uniref:Serpentine Receptor, class H n=1 Tax=Panagrellus redivivus TaxID=6233 RepID=A0A7E4VVM7_PANRE
MYYRNFHNATIDDIDHPVINKICSIVYALFTVINIAFAIPTLYIIVFKSTRAMGVYKHYLLLEIVCSCFFTIIGFAWQPVFMWPLRAVYGAGIINKNVESSRIVVITYCTTIVCMIVIQSMQAFYQLVVSLHSENFMKKLVKNVYAVYAVFVINVGCIAGTGCILLIPNNNLSPEIMNAKFINDIPAMAPFIKSHPSFIGYHPDVTNNIETIITFSLTVNALLPFVVIITSIVFYYIMKRLKRMVSQHTYAVHIMLLRSLFVQLSMQLIFIIIPIILCSLTLKIEAAWGSYVTTPSLTFASTHLFLEAIGIIYFVKPYRRYFSKTIRTLRRRVQATKVVSPSQNDNGVYNTYTEKKSITVSHRSTTNLWYLVSQNDS